MANSEVLISIEEACKLLNISKPTFKKWVDLARPEVFKEEGKRGKAAHFYRRKDIILLEVAYLRALADQKAKKILTFQEV